MKKLVGIAVVALSVFAISCQKDQDLFPQAENLSEKSAQIVVNEISVDNAIADINFESDFFIGAEGMMTGIQGGGMMQGGGMHGGGINWGSDNSMHYMMGQGPEYSMHGNQGQYPDSIVMNYGEGMQLSNGRVMSGSMIIHTSEEPNGDSFMRKITYDNFSVDSMSITGTTSMFISGYHQNGGKHDLTEDLMITLPNGTTIHRESEITREWIAGSETNLDQTDDVMQVTGHVINTITENGTEIVYRKDIVEAMIKSTNCRYFSQGIIELSQNGNVIATLDYGQGDCDDVALLTKTGENPVEIILSENDNCAIIQTGMGQGFSTGNGMGMGDTDNNGMDQDSTVNNIGTGMDQDSTGYHVGDEMDDDDHQEQGNGMGQDSTVNNNGMGMDQDSTGYHVGDEIDDNDHQEQGNGMGQDSTVNNNGMGMGMGQGTSTGNGMGQGNGNG